MSMKLIHAIIIYNYTPFVLMKIRKRRFLGLNKVHTISAMISENIQTIFYSNTPINRTRILYFRYNPCCDFKETILSEKTVQYPQYRMTTSRPNHRRDTLFLQKPRFHVKCLDAKLFDFR